jgi:hypothetical protein
MSKSTTPRADPHRDPIYLAVGRGIEKWSWVETNLAMLLEGLVRARRRGLLGPAYHAVINFKDKLRVVDEVAQRTLKGKRLETWSKLRKRISKKADKRNEIAHAAIVLHGNVAPLEARLHPYWSITKGVVAVKGEGLTARDLEQRAVIFTALSVDILDFYRTLPKRLRRH